MAYTQDNRLIAIDTPLGKDVLLLHRFDSSEGISGLFHFSLELLSENHSISFKDIIGKQVTISLKVPGEKTRYWNGVISRFACVGADNRFSYYHAEMVPWLWFLTRTADCRIFQEMTTPEIVEAIFKIHGFQSFRRDQHGSFPAHEYCVQYRETAFNFVSRLMEEAGIFYFFEHEKTSHTLVMSNYPQVHKDCPFQHEVRFNYAGGVVTKDEDLVTSWNAEQELRSGKYAITDFNFQTPTTSLMAKTDTIDEIGGNTKYEIYDYPGPHTKKSEGEDLVKLRIQEEEAIHQLVRGTGNCRTFASGYKFNVTEHSRKDMTGQYVLTEVSHSASVGQSYAGSGETGGEVYRNHFVCIPLNVPYRPQRLTPKPIIQGPQTAIVKGKKEEEIWTDKYGRVKVRFHWDRLETIRKGDQEEPIKDEERSCWIRVSQPWAGKNWGAINIPRIGQEVIVEFLEGDPDRPLITGRVYNDALMPPYTLPDNMTRTTFLTRSTKKGGSSNFNELRFEDKKDNEQIFMNAEKDMDLRVEHDSREFVGNDRSLIVQNDQKEKVGGEQDIQIAKDQNESVGGDASLNVTGNQNVQVGQTMSLQVGQNLQEKSGQNYAHEAGMEIHLKAGMNVVIEAGLELTIMASGNFINIGPAGVAISGTLVLINSGGAAGSGSPSSPTSPKAPKDPDTADDGSKGGKM
jgi:type VI secretion system secreted protein VgrG